MMKGSWTPWGKCTPQSPSSQPLSLHLLEKKEAYEEERRHSQAYDVLSCRQYDVIHHCPSDLPPSQWLEPLSLSPASSFNCTKKPEKMGNSTPVRLRAGCSHGMGSPSRTHGRTCPSAAILAARTFKAGWRSFQHPGRLWGLLPEGGIATEALRVTSLAPRTLTPCTSSLKAMLLLFSRMFVQNLRLEGVI